MAGLREDCSALVLPLLERLRYLTIVSSNLDEFFEVRMAAHLQALSGSDRQLYLALARETLRLARTSGLEESEARRMERLLMQ